MTKVYVVHPEDASSRLGAWPQGLWIVSSVDPDGHVVGIEVCAEGGVESAVARLFPAEGGTVWPPRDGYPAAAPQMSVEERDLSAVLSTPSVLAAVGSQDRAAPLGFSIPRAVPPSEVHVLAGPEGPCIRIGAAVAMAFGWRPGTGFSLALDGSGIQAALFPDPSGRGSVALDDPSAEHAGFVTVETGPFLGLPSSVNRAIQAGSQPVRIESRDGCLVIGFEHMTRHPSGAEAARQPGSLGGMALSAALAFMLGVSATCVAMIVLNGGPVPPKEVQAVTGSKLDFTVPKDLVDGVGRDDQEPGFEDGVVTMPRPPHPDGHEPHP